MTSDNRDLIRSIMKIDFGIRDMTYIRCAQKKMAR